MPTAGGEVLGGGGGCYVGGCIGDSVRVEPFSLLFGGRAQYGHGQAPIDRCSLVEKHLLLSEKLFLLCFDGAVKIAVWGP